MALLPLPEVGNQPNSHRCSLVWTLPDEDIERVMALTEAAFIDELQSAFGYRLGVFTSVGERSCYPLALHRSDSHVTHRVAVVGNASQTLHPIAGQGLNLGMRDIQSLVEQVTKAHQSDQDIGTFKVLHAFADDRRRDQQQVISMTDTLVRTFSNRHLPLVVGRNIGLLAMQLIPEFKRGLALQAMGLNR